MSYALENITEDWLKKIGFRWHELERQNTKHWLLWIGHAHAENRLFQTSQDLGIELAATGYYNQKGELVNSEKGYNCWLRSDCASRYHRFIHIRYLKKKVDLLDMLNGLICRPFNPNECVYGSWHIPERAEALREEQKRLDKKVMMSDAWYEIEKDDSMGGALPEHKEAYETGRR